MARAVAVHVARAQHVASPGRRSVARFLARRTAIAGGIVSLAFIVMMLLGPWITPYRPTATDYEHTLGLPSPAHLAGTDDFGRDILSRIIVAASYSLGMGLGAVCVGAVVGVAWGIASGFYGRAFDNISMRIVDILLAFPGILLAIVVVAILGPGLFNVVLAIGVFSVPSFARLARAPVLAAMGQEYVQAARAVGASNARIMMRHLLPAVLPPCLVYVTLRIGTAIITASSLSFLGLGVQPPTPEWGAMLAQSRLFLNVAPHLVIGPGIAISLAVLGFNLLGDGMRDALDPRLRD